MPVNSTPPFIEYSGNGVLTSFAIPAFSFTDNDQIVVKLVNESTGAETTQTEGVHYTVTGGDPGTAVSFVTAPTSAQIVRIDRYTPRTQPDTFTTRQTYMTAQVQDNFDRTIRMIQEMQEQINRSIKFKMSVDPVDVNAEMEAFIPADVQGRVIRFNDDGDGVTVGPTADDIENAVVYASNAATSASAAAASASAAATSAASASSNATNAATSASAAAASASAAAASATSASNSATQAANSETNAANSATSAAASAAAAAASATAAAASATTASTQATNAANSAAAAATSATNAANSATAAAASATAAAASATAAAGSEAAAAATVSALVPFSYGTPAAPEPFATGDFGDVESGKYTTIWHIEGSVAGDNINCKPTDLDPEFVGQRLIYVGCSDSKRVTFLQSSSEYKLNGPITFVKGTMLVLLAVNDGSFPGEVGWIEESRNGI